MTISQVDDHFAGCWRHPALDAERDNCLSNPACLERFLVRIR